MKRHDLQHVLRYVPDLIQHGGHRVARHREATRRIVTAVFWALWVWAVLPLVTFVAWLAGAERAYVELFARAPLEDLAFILPRYAVIVLVIALVFVNWATLQRYWWQGRERRRLPPDAPPGEIAERFSADEEALAKAREARIVVVHHDDEGRPYAFVNQDARLR